MKVQLDTVATFPSSSNITAYRINSGAWQTLTSGLNVWINKEAAADGYRLWHARKLFDGTSGYGIVKYDFTSSGEDMGTYTDIAYNSYEMIKNSTADAPGTTTQSSPQGATGTL